jgi:hypothetical protein
VAALHGGVPGVQPQGREALQQHRDGDAEQCTGKVVADAVVRPGRERKVDPLRPTRCRTGPRWDPRRRGRDRQRKRLWSRSSSERLRLTVRRHHRDPTERRWLARAETSLTTPQPFPGVAARPIRPSAGLSLDWPSTRPGVYSRQLNGRSVTWVTPTFLFERRFVDRWEQDGGDHESRLRGRPPAAQRREAGLA